MKMRNAPGHSSPRSINTYDIHHALNLQLDFVNGSFGQSLYDVTFTFRWTSRTFSTLHLPRQGHLQPNWGAYDSAIQIHLIYIMVI